MEDNIKCDYCGWELCEDDTKSETTCDTCWEFFEAEYEEHEEY